MTWSSSAQVGMGLGADVYRKYSGMYEWSTTVVKVNTPRRSTHDTKGICCEFTVISGTPRCLEANLSNALNDSDI